MGNSEPLAKHHQLHGVQPVLPVPDVAAAADWFVRVLGFTLDFLHGEPPCVHGRVKLGDRSHGDPIYIHLSRNEGLIQPCGETRLHVGHDIDGLHAHALAQGAGVNERRALLAGEVADLWFHCLIMLAHYGLAPGDVLAELQRRAGTGGIDHVAGDVGQRQHLRVAEVEDLPDRRLMSGSGEHGVDDVVDRAQQSIYDVTERRSSEDYTILEELMQPTMDELEAIGSRGGSMSGVPTGFADLDAARTWAAEFVRWYNVVHRHSGIRYVTPGQRHDGHDHTILAARHELYLKARELNPARWSGATRDWTPTGQVTLNPERDSVIAAHSTADDRQPLAA